MSERGAEIEGEEQEKGEEGFGVSERERELGIFLKIKNLYCDFSGNQDRHLS